jgi:hypothetical protein
VRPLYFNGVPSLISAAVVADTPITSLVEVVKASVRPTRGLMVTPVPAVKFARYREIVPTVGAPVIVHVSVGAAPVSAMVQRYVARPLITEIVGPVTVET